LSLFQICSNFSPAGDQPQAIEQLLSGFGSGLKRQVLLGVTGSGKTFTVAHVIAGLQRPTLILAHNKTLAAQLYGELKALFPQSAVEYFVSYYDYYQPEAYLPQRDLFIEKDARINEEIDRLRHAATRALLEREDVIIVSSVSCIYGLGSIGGYSEQLIKISQGDQLERDQLMARLVEIQYSRNDIDFHRGTFRVRGDLLEIFPVHEESSAIRVEFFGDEVESISRVDPLRGRNLSRLESVTIYPGSHYVTGSASIKSARAQIGNELQRQLARFKAEGKLVEAQRLEQRSLYDLEQLKELGFCSGIENYSRYLSGQEPGQPPPCLLDYFPKEWLLIVDESHVTLPQVRGMYRGDRARKLNLVEYGFRLPSALDNRPLKYEEFEALQDRVIYLSATPAEHELERSHGVVVEQIIRPTGLLDPMVELRPAREQVDDLLAEIHLTLAQGERVLVTTLTKRMAEDLTEYYQELGIKVRYLHADIGTIERSAILRDLRLGVFDVLIGINLLREGLDLPEVSLVAILDADKEGFLRNRTSLIQTIGRAARNAQGRVLLYAERHTDSIKAAMEETTRRRQLQMAHNEAHNIKPQTVSKEINDLERAVEALSGPVEVEAAPPIDLEGMGGLPGLATQIQAHREAMLKAAQALEFELAAEQRDKLQALERLQLLFS